MSSDRMLAKIKLARPASPAGSGSSWTAGSSGPPPPRPLQPARKRLVLVQEDGRVRQPEAVDALLYVAHGEEVLPLPGHRPEDGVLHLVGILILVHQDLPVPARHLRPSSVGPPSSATSSSSARCSWSEKVGAVSPQLFLPIGSAKVRGQLQQRRHGRGHRPQVLHGLLPADGQELSSFFTRSLALSHSCLSPQHVRVVLRPSGGGQPGKPDRSGRLPRLLPVRRLPPGPRSALAVRNFSP